MTVAPLTGPYAGREQAAFERLMDFHRLRETHPAANMVSAGMSADLERGRGGRSDTCTRRYGGTRSPSQARVTSPRSRTTAENMVITAERRA